MSEEDYKIITKIIDADIEAKNLEDLKKIKNYLDSKIGSFREPFINVQDYYDILTMKLRDFLNENITSKGFKKVHFLMAIKKFKKLDSYDEVYVFDTIGINRKMILKSGNNIGEKSLDIFEEALRSYGIERSGRIQIEEREKLNDFRKKEKRKIR